MTDQKKYVSYLEERNADPRLFKLFCQERAKLEVTEAICAAMERKKVSRAELARRLGTTCAAITMLLRHGNITMERMGQIANALDCNITVKFVGTRPKK